MPLRGGISTFIYQPQKGGKLKIGKTERLHKLLNRERTRRGLSYARWSQSLWHGCKHHSTAMLRSRHLSHAPVSALPDGGECIVGGRGNHSARTLSKSWMHSPKHKAAILNPHIKNQAVAISQNRYGTYATWRGSTAVPLRLPNFLKSLLHILFPSI